ncbi:hypothetical protein KC717_02790 [Candidatus Dojkabacteria bacterium]|uniref:Transmembrane protein n=1 Tax=Candidatus Dojkabacteria bacterium TaxID=2099670 RepID=A0A955L7R3_9BACT|nr:hypothetical protein [Candidatus Dojkabacteria bacterium]
MIVVTRKSKRIIILTLAGLVLLMVGIVIWNTYHIRQASDEFSLCYDSCNTGSVEVGQSYLDCINTCDEVAEERFERIVVDL